MKDKAEKIDWDALTEQARQAYMKNQVVVDWGDFWEGYVAGYQAAFEAYR